MRPDFIVPGFPKSGTTWLFDRLAELPDFAMPPHKELHFFNRHPSFNKGEAGAVKSYLALRKLLLRKFDLTSFAFFREYLRFYEKNEDTYLRLFGQRKGLSGDITPLYCLLDDSGVERMSRLLNGVKVVFILRDPISRDWSQFRMHIRKTGQEISDIQDIDIINFFERDLHKRRGAYRQAIERYVKYFDQSPIMVTLYDLLQDSPKTFLEQIVQFLGGDPQQVQTFAKLEQRANVSKQFPYSSRISDYLKEKNRLEYDWLMNDLGIYKQSIALEAPLTEPRYTRESIILNDQNL